MTEKIRKVQFPYIGDDEPLEIDDKVLYTNDDILTKIPSGKVENKYSNSRTTNIRKAPTSAVKTGQNFYGTKDVFKQNESPRRNDSTKKESSLPKEPKTEIRKVKYVAPERPKGYVYPTERQQTISPKKELKQHPLGERKVPQDDTNITVGKKFESKSDVEDGRKLTRTRKDFDTLAQESISAQERKNKLANADKVQDDYFEKKRQLLSMPENNQ